VISDYNSCHHTLIEGFRYWDWPIDPSNYSYVDVATDVFGYSTFAIDRLCAGNSTLADPFTVCQAQAETSAVDVLTTMLREGAIPGLNTSARPIVHIGHSYGSVISYLLAAQFPNNTDGIVLTGYSQNATGFAATVAGFGIRTAPSNLPAEFGDLDPGYLIYDDIFNEQYIFMFPPFVTRENEIVVEQLKLPFAFGEIVTTGSTVAPADQFKGPALVLTGRQDSIFCGGDCLATGDPNVPSIPATMRQNLPNASPFEVIIQPNTGHLVNLHFNATGAFNAINNFLESNHL
jgi:pimeloyl-ACP methyl ester carboxylesterase